MGYLIQRFVLATLFLGAQLAFDAASVRENTESSAAERLRRTPEGGIDAQHFRARFLVTIAYGLEPFQLVGMPGWTNETYYDIKAKPAARSSTTRDQMAEMLRALLVDRFKLRFHREHRQMDGFALVRVKRDALGPGMKASAIDCEKTPALRPCGLATGDGSAFVATGASLWSLLQRLIPEVNAPIDDETGLSGAYDITLRWSGDPTANDELPSLFTALQEQLGLKLERRRVTVDVFIVDRFERPVPN